MTGAPRYVVLGPVHGQAAVHPVLAERLRHAGISWSDDGHVDAIHTAGLALHWGTDIACYLETAQPMAPVRAEVRDAIECAYRSGVPILAPCVSMLVVIDALAGIASEADLAERRGEDGLALFPGVGAIGSRRPLMGQDDAHVRAWWDAALDRAARWRAAAMKSTGTAP